MNRPLLQLTLGIWLLWSMSGLAQVTDPAGIPAPVRTLVDSTLSPVDMRSMTSAPDQQPRPTGEPVAGTGPGTAAGTSADPTSTGTASGSRQRGTTSTPQERAQPDTAPSTGQRELRLLGQQPVMPVINSSRGPEEELIKSEILIIAGTVAEARTQQQLLRDYGLRIKRRLVLKSLSMVLSVYRVPTTSDSDALLEQLQQHHPQLQAEFNRYYFLQGSPGREYARPLTGLPDPASIGSGLYLAMLDGKVDTQHPALRNSRIESLDITGQDTAASRHGTAVASLLVGQDFVSGALPMARLLAVNIFTPGTRSELRTRTDWWLLGLETIFARIEKPRALNMSFGGGDSWIIGRALARFRQANILLVAAAGNGGRNSPVLFPASHPDVIAVAAVDIQQRKARTSPDSPLLDAVAPGVDVWAADLDGKGFYASGSSYAAPWVTAVLAAHTDTLPALTSDLGAVGQDPVFGHGMIHWKK